jgi:hypothetical protein
VSVILHHCARCGGRVTPYRSSSARKPDRIYWCPACRQQLPAPNVDAGGSLCPGCQGVMPRGATFCAHCGFALAERPGPAAEGMGGAASTDLSPAAVAPLKLVLDLLPRLTAKDLEVVAGLCQERLRTLRGPTP